MSNLKQLKTKDIYWIILERNHDCLTPSNTIESWKLRYNYDNDEIKKVFQMPYKSTRRTDLQSIQYKIIYKIINCNYWLHKMQILDQPKCRFCHENETIEHFFFACKVTKQFWKSFQTWWNGITGQNINIIEERDVLLGYFKDGNDHKIFNCCLLIGKAMIYRVKNLTIQPDIYIYHCDLKVFIEVERNLALNQNKLDILEDEWGDILDI